MRDMAFSDDECEAKINTVSNYDFVDDNDEPISFCELSIQWKKGVRSVGKRKHIFLRGDADNGNMKIYEEVTAWKFDLSSMKPDIWVLHKKESWILLLKPRKAYEDTIIRSVVVTLHCLQFFRKNPDSSLKSMWENMHKVFSFERRPSDNDLMEHTDFISEALKHDALLAKSKVLVTFLKERPTKNRNLDEVNDKTLSGFIDDDLADECSEDLSDDDEDDQFESVCAICDNGGEIICCEGKCLRSFHATKEAGRESYCESLGFTRQQVDAIQKFYCKNCEYQKHQCFACGKLGSSDLSSGAEVFRCFNATCGRFYHPHCVAKLLNRNNQLNVESLVENIAAGKDFACPMHQCFVCNMLEDKKNKELQFAICRRCPRSYHRKCLPSEIAFEENEDEGIVQRAWDNLIPNRILLYCLEHEIDEELLTPTRNHLKFPGINLHKIKQKPELVGKKKIVRKSISPLSEAVNQNYVAKQKSSTGSFGVSSKKREGKLPPPTSFKKQRVVDTTRKSLEKASSAKQYQPAVTEGKVSLGQKLFELNQRMSNDAEPVGSNEVAKVSFAKKETGTSLTLDADSKKRILSIVKDSSNITLDTTLKKLKVPTENVYSSKFAIDKSITLGKVEGSIKAIRTALQRLEEGGSVDDAKVVCDPAHLTQIMKWKNKLKVYLAPFLYGVRYTSFGRHFTQVDKLKEIVSMLQWYVQDGDTIVDFCCGSNDFSCLMKTKVDEIGKKCSFRNFDILQPKNDFCFEKRDWMTVQPKELPPGSKLIMGLNPPFGVNAGLANKFINKALEFKPKLLILIVPRETQRLDGKKNPYNLIWQNDELLSGKAFYLPGSIDVNDKTLEDWNLSTPPLYLWSRPDWTRKHKEIAEYRGHLSRDNKLDGNQSKKPPVTVDDLEQLAPPPPPVRVKVNTNKAELTKSPTDAATTTGCLNSSSAAAAVEAQNVPSPGGKKKPAQSSKPGICSKKKKKRKRKSFNGPIKNNKPMPRHPSPSMSDGGDISIHQGEECNYFSSSSPGKCHIPPSYRQERIPLGRTEFGVQYNNDDVVSKYLPNRWPSPPGPPEFVPPHHTQAQIYGEDYLSQNTVGLDHGFPLHGRMSTAAAGWSQPPQQLHEVNQSRMNNFNNPRSSSSHRSFSSLDFAEGPYRPFSQNSSGWIND